MRALFIIDGPGKFPEMVVLQEGHEGYMWFGWEERKAIQKEKDKFRKAKLEQ